MRTKTTSGGRALGLGLLIWVCACSSETEVPTPFRFDLPVPDSQFKWLGPTSIAGRVRAIVIHPGDPQTIWAAAATGGIWKTTDGGVTWKPLDDYLPSLTVTALAIDPFNSKTLYAGTGEIFTFLAEGLWPRGQDRGAGVFVTHDGGASWAVLPETKTLDWRFVSRIAVQPNNSGVLLAATGSGVWRSIDRGQRWSQVLPGKIALDVKFHPLRVQNAVAGTQTEGAYFSDDSGATWNPSTPPPGAGFASARVELAASRAASGDWRAGLFSGDGIVLLRSSDGGASWSHLRAGGAAVCCDTDITKLCTVGAAGAPLARNNRRYTGALWVDPRDSSKLIVGGVHLCRSLDDGASFKRLSGFHSDIHTVAETPNFVNKIDDRILVGDDGGVFRLRAYDSASPPVAENLNAGLRTTQFHGAAMNPISGIVVGGVQDSGILMATPSANGLSWTVIQLKAGDGGMSITDPTNGGRFWYGKSVGRVFRTLDSGATQACITASSGRPITEVVTDEACGDPGAGTFCANFFPMALDRTNTNRLYVGCGQLWRTDQARAPASQVEWTSVKERSGNFALSSIAQAPSDPQVMWLGSGLRVGSDYGNGGQIWRTTNLSAPDADRVWTRLDEGKGLPARPVTRIAVDPTNAEIAYVSFSGFGVDHIWRTGNGGTDWAPVSAGLPDVPVWSLAIHPGNRHLIYAGTDAGVFTSPDDGKSWSATTRGPANVPVTDLQFVDSRRLIVATYGRGTQELDATLNPEALFPEAVAIAKGIAGGGRVEHLLASDDRRLRFLDLATSITVTLSTRAVSSSAENRLGSLSFHVESRASGGKLRIELFNASTGAFVEPRGVLAAPTSDAAIIVAAPGAASAYLHPTTRELKARLSWTGVTSAEIDTARWTLQRP